jgi:hemoglobin
VRRAAITEEGLQALVRHFYGAATKDEMLGPVFEAIDDLEPHLITITEFWVSSMLATRRYSGNPLAQHRKHPIKPEMFDRWLALWGQSADTLFAPEPARALKEKAARIAESLKLGLFFDPAKAP